MDCLHKIDEEDTHRVGSFEVVEDIEAIYRKSDKIELLGIHTAPVDDNIIIKVTCLTRREFFTPSDSLARFAHKIETRSIVVRTP